MDKRPRTVVVHQLPGIGDLVWHIPYFRAIAEQSQDGVIVVVARPSTRARELLSAEPCVAEVLDYDRRPRRKEARKGEHDGLTGIWRMARTLGKGRFDRIVMFSDRTNHGLLAWLSRIPERSGFGFSWLQRLFLNKPPYIERYRGPSVHVYKEATAFAIAHRFCDRPLLPRMNVPEAAVARMAQALSALPRPLYAFAIGTSETYKQWGAERFGALASALVMRGIGVVVLGGPNDADLANEIAQAVAPDRRSALALLTNGSVLETAAALCVADACIGNDTGALSIAAACERPSYCVLGPRPLLDHDPMIRMLRAPTLLQITAEDVLRTLASDGAPGFGDRASGAGAGATEAGATEAGATGQACKLM